MTEPLCTVLRGERFVVLGLIHDGLYRSAEYHPDEVVATGGHYEINHDAQATHVIVRTLGEKETFNPGVRFSPRILNYLRALKLKAN